MKLPFTITRPIAFFDLETTGTSPATDKIVEIAILKYFPDGTTTMKHMVIDPGIPIPKAASDVHKITDDRIRELKSIGLAPTFPEVAVSIYNEVLDCDLGGYNISFDVPLLYEEFMRVNLEWPLENVFLLDAYNIFAKMEPRNLKAAVKFYLDEDLEDAHTADADTTAAFRILNVQCRGYEDLIGKTLAEVAEFCKRNNNVDLAGKMVKDEDGRVKFTFGKYKDQYVYDSFKKDASYYHFLMKSDFTSNTKKYFEKYYKMATKKGK